MGIAKSMPVLASNFPATCFGGPFEEFTALRPLNLILWSIGRNLKAVRAYQNSPSDVYDKSNSTYDAIFLIGMEMITSKS